MKYAKILFLLCLSCKHVSAQDYKGDSLFLSKQLNPYRKHLDSILPKVDWQNLIDLYHMKMETEDSLPVMPKVLYDTLTWLNYANSDYTVINSIVMKPPKYIAEKISELDSNRILFFETGFDLNNRKELLYLKNSYSETKVTYNKINILLKYINALNKSLPHNSNFKFSRSNTLNKYLNQISVLLRKTPNDATKAIWLINYAKTLNHIDPQDLYFYIYTVYVDAETVLLAPYFISMSKISRLKIVGNEYEKYLLNHKFGFQLIDVYWGIINSLSEINKYGENNLRYPILRKITDYKFKLIEILRIVSKYDKKWLEDLDDSEESIIADFTLKPLVPATQYGTELITDRVSTLNEFVSKLLVNSTSTTPDRRRAILYFSLGIMFDNNHESEYALKAYFKAMEFAIKSKHAFGAQWFEMLYYKISEKYKNELFQNLLSPSNKSDYYKHFSLYKHTNDYQKLEQTHPKQSYYTMRVINFVRYLCIGGYTDSAKNFLLTYKMLLVNDSANLYTNVNELVLVYKELSENNWLENYSNKTRIEYYLDSLMASSFSKNEESFIPYGSNGNITQDFYSINKIVDDSRWNYKTNELNKKIRIKENEIEKLNLERTKLINGNESLNEEIRKKNKILEQTTEKNKQLDSTNSNLVKLNEQLVKKSTTLSQTISNQKNEIWFWTKISIAGIVVAIVLPFFVGYVIANKKKKEIRILNTEIKKLDVQKKNLELETLNLKSIIEANRLIHKAELQSANDKILRELTVKHEIVGLVTELYNGYENRFLNRKDKVVDFKVELSEFGGRFKNLESFSKHYYKLLQNNEFNSTNDEIELCKRYVDVVKIRKSNFDVTFKDLRTIKRNDIVLPHHILNNFCKNSIEKGKIIGRPLKITVEDKVTNGDYFIIISDDGKGLSDNFSLNNLPPESTGFKNTLEQINYYNAIPKLPYLIYFDEHSIINRAGFENNSGVSINLKFKLKPHAI